MEAGTETETADRDVLVECFSDSDGRQRCTGRVFQEAVPEERIAHEPNVTVFVRWVKSGKFSQLRTSSNI